MKKCLQYFFLFLLLFFKKHTRYNKLMPLKYSFYNIINAVFTPICTQTFILKVLLAVLSLAEGRRQQEEDGHMEFMSLEPPGQNGHYRRHGHHQKK